MLKLTIGLFLFSAVFSFKQLNRFYVLQNIVKAMETKEDDFFNKDLSEPDGHFTGIRKSDLVSRKKLFYLLCIDSDKFNICEKFSVDSVEQVLTKQIRSKLLKLSPGSRVELKFNDMGFEILMPVFPKNLLLDLYKFLKEEVVNLESSSMIVNYIKDYNTFKELLKDPKNKGILRRFYERTDEVMQKVESICFEIGRLFERLFAEGYSKFVNFYSTLYCYYGNINISSGGKFSAEQEKISKVNEKIRIKKDSFIEFCRKFMEYLRGWGLTFRNIKEKIYEKAEKDENGEVPMYTSESKVINQRIRPVFDYYDEQSKTKKTPTNISYESVSFIGNKIKRECEKLLNISGDKSLKEDQRKLLSYLSSYINGILCLEGVNYYASVHDRAFSEIGDYELMCRSISYSLNKTDGQITDDDVRNIKAVNDNTAYFCKKLRGLEISQDKLDKFKQIFDERFMKYIGHIENYRRGWLSYFKNRALFLDKKLTDYKNKK